MVSVRTVRLLGVVAGSLVLAHVVGLVVHRQFDLPRDSGFLRQVDLNAEASLTAWFASFLLLCCAAVTWGLTVEARSRDDKLAPRWAALSALFLLMTVDETAQLHDLATGPLRRWLDLEFGVLHYAWLIPAMAGLAVATLYLWPLARSLSHGDRFRLLAAAGVYLAGAVGLEMVGGNVVDDSHQTLAYLSVVTVEETAELVGTLMLLAALLTMWRRVQPVVVLRLDGGSVTDAKAAPGSLTS